MAIEKPLHIDPNIGSATPQGLRKQAAARKEARAAYPFMCCAICGLQIPTCLAVAHLDHDPSNNKPDNLAYLCHTHHWMHDAALYPSEGVKLLRDHWTKTEGKPCHKAKMKDAGKKAVLTKQKAALSLKRSAAARKAHMTRKTKGL